MKSDKKVTHTQTFFHFVISLVKKRFFINKDMSLHYRKKMEIYVNKCKPIPVIFPKSEDGERLPPQWLILLTVLSNSPDISDNEKFRVSGNILNQIIGFDALTYVQLSPYFPELINFLQKYFECSKFIINPVLHEVIDISLPPGNQLTFLRWLSFQPNFDYEAFYSKIIEINSELFEDE